MQVDGVEKDYIQLAYAGSDTLYVPATQLDLVSKFIGGGENPDGTQKAKLSKLGGTDWAKAKSKAKKATKEMAKQLIALYAQRQRQPGYAFHSDDRGSGNLRTNSPSRRPMTSSAASRRSRQIWNVLSPWIGCCAATWAMARRRLPCGR